MVGRKMNGEGSIYRRSSDGMWIGAVTLGYNANGATRRKTVSAKSKSAVLDKMRALERQIEGGLPPSDDRMTVKALLEQWFRDIVRHRVAPVAFENYRTIADRHIVPTLGRKRVAKLTTADVDALLGAKLDEGYSTSTVRRIRAVLVQALDQAVVWGMVPRNVATATRGPRMRRHEARSLTPRQARTLLAAARGDRLEACYVTMLALGLRRGEALGLMWWDVDLEARTLTVRRSLKRVGSDLVLGEVKTGTSRRTINLPQPVVKALKAHRAAQNTARLEWGDEWADHGLVFTTQRGMPLDPRNFFRDFQKLTERAGLGKWHPHELRHSAASIMLASGVPLEVVRDVLGHSSIRMTADVYGHIMPPQRQQAATAMAKALWS